MRSATLKIHQKSRQNPPKIVPKPFPNPPSKKDASKTRPQIHFLVVLGEDRWYLPKRAKTLATTEDNPKRSKTAENDQNDRTQSQTTEKTENYRKQPQTIENDRNNRKLSKTTAHDQKRSKPIEDYHTSQKQDLVKELILKLPDPIPGAAPSN